MVERGQHDAHGWRRGRMEKGGRLMNTYIIEEGSHRWHQCACVVFVTLPKKLSAKGGFTPLLTMSLERAVRAKVSATLSSVDLRGYSGNIQNIFEVKTSSATSCT